MPAFPICPCPPTPGMRGAHTMCWALFQGCGQSREHQTHISHQLPRLQDPSAGSWASAHTILFPLRSLPCRALCAFSPRKMPLHPSRLVSGVLLLPESPWVTSPIPHTLCFLPSTEHTFAALGACGGWRGGVGGVYILYFILCVPSSYYRTRHTVGAQ